jgi:hypothetical protein
MGWDLDRARRESQSVVGGRGPFLICFGTSLLICAIAWFFLPLKQAALAVMFQGGLALPTAFMLERKMAWGPMAKENPAEHVVRAARDVADRGVSHRDCDVRSAARRRAARDGINRRRSLLPYAWLQRTNVYVWLAVAVSAGALGLQMALGVRAFPFVLMHMTLCYWIGAVLVYRAARQLTITTL